MKSLPNVIVASVTPYDAENRIDAAGHTSNVNALIDQGCRGFLVAGSTGEGPYLAPGERAELVAATRTSTEPVTILCGINAESVGQGVTQISEAADAGADVALVAVPGTLIRDNDVAIVRYFEMLADRSPLPLLLYNFPRVTGYELPTSSVTTLAGHPDIIGLKDSGGDVSRLDDLTGIIAAGFVVYAGASRVVHDSMAAGAFGAMTASANYAFALVSAAVGGDREAQEQLTDITTTIESHGIPGTKSAAECSGLQSGPPRPPLMPVDPDAVEAIRAAVESAQQRSHG